MTQGLLVLAGMTDCLMSFKDMNFVPSEADPDVWMRPAKYESRYEYSAAYVDDLAIALKNPKKITDQLQHKYKFKFKGTEPLTYQVRCVCTKDNDGTLVADPTQYVEKILESKERTFGSKHKKARPLLEESDHPELDTSELSSIVQITNI